MSVHKQLSILLICLFLISGCGSGADTETATEVDDKGLNQIMAAKTPFALSKTTTPVLSTHDWDLIFGGAEGDVLKYDRFGEIDELVFMARPETFFSLQRQIRKKTRSGSETIYYKVTTPSYQGSESLWVDGRFLDVRDVRPQVKPQTISAARTLINLRSYEGEAFTWHGSDKDGSSELLEYYPPAQEISSRYKDDWTLKGFDSLGMLYSASEGATPLDLKSLARFGKEVWLDLNALKVEEGDDATLKKTELLISKLKPLDVIQMDDRIWVVLDKGKIIQSKYQSKFAGSVQISAQLDTIHGLISKAVLVKDAFKELEDKNAKKFYIRRYADTSNLLEQQLLGDGVEEEEEAVVDEAAASDEDGVPVTTSAGSGSTTKTITLTVDDGSAEEEGPAE